MGPPFVPALDYLRHSALRSCPAVLYAAVDADACLVTSLMTGIPHADSD
jgi:hypothetical protein